MSTTTVTGTVVDPDAIAWAGGTAIFKLINTNPNITPNVNGVPLTAAQQNFVVNLDNTGSFSTTVTDTNTIQPLSKWQVEFTSNTSAPAQYLTPLVITGGSQSLNTQIAAQIVAIRLTAGTSTRAYADIEIIATPPAGAVYYNTTSNTTRVWNGTSWTSQGGGGSASLRQVYLSSIAGMVLDCNIVTGQKIGGGVPTDNTTIINTWLASVGGITNPTELIIDGGFACKGLVLPAAGYIKLRGLGWGTGFFTLSGANADPINNGSYAFQPGGSAPATGGPIFLENFYINGNRGNGTTGNSTSGNPRGTGTYWYCNITIYNTTGVYIEHMYIYDAPAYSIRLINCNQGTIANNIMYNPNTTAGVNNDGIHCDSPVSDLFIHNNLIVNNNSDDAVALNQPEGYTGGTIDRIFIYDNDFVSVLHGLRIYGNADGAVGTISFTGNYILASTVGIQIGNNATGTGDYSGRSLICAHNEFSLAANNCAVIRFDSAFGDVMMDDNTWISPNQIGNGYFVLLELGNVSNLTLNNNRIYRTTVGNNNATYFIGDFGGTIVKRCTINNAMILDEQGHTFTAVPYLVTLINATISSLYVMAQDLTNIGAFSNSYTRLTNVYGPGFQQENNIQTKSGAYTLLQTDRLILGDTTSASFAVTLPTTNYAGMKFIIKNIAAANTLTITGTVDGSANPTLTAGQFITIQYDGTAWRKVG